jgi:very-short-patch-repair endonuclease
VRHVSAASLRRLAPLARRQYGVFTTAQAEAMGVERWTLARMTRAGDLERLFQGVYRLTIYPDSWELRWLAALLAAGAGAAVSHAAAAHLLGLQHTGTADRPELELAVPRAATHPELTGIRIHTQVGLRAGDVVLHGRFRVTSAAWTLASLAHGLGLPRTERALGAAVANGATTIEELAGVTVRRRWCPGVPVMRAALLRISPEMRLTRSDAERVFLRLCREAGLPDPEVNLRVTDARGRTRVLDAAWPAWSVCVEIDVHPDHDGTIGRSSDGRRQNDLVAAWTVLRFDAIDLRHDRSYVVDQVRETLRAAGAPV